ncbi:gamma-glutamylcyclotransferase family protein [Kribbella sp. NPDC051770]|uniref:gamma-glutamylcyclotransferase family protein n=1 Tax=Kribbella sp. NPDC051770 TaxID=3155413 RepID=UPI003417A143
MSDKAADRRTDVFFYGLYMDPDILINLGVEPRHPRTAAIHDHVLRIGRQATLEPRPDAQAFGMLYSLTQSDMDLLYGQPGLEGYRAEPVLARTLHGDAVPATSYVLSQPPDEDEEPNHDYVKALHTTLTRMGLPLPTESSGS